MRITSKDIYDVISQKSHIDIKRNYNRLVNKIEHRLKREIVGQEKAKEEFISYVLELAKNEKLREKIGVNANKTLVEKWNGTVGMKRLLEFSDKKLLGQELPIFEDGPCSIDNSI